MSQYHGPIEEEKLTDEQKMRRAKQLPAFPVNVYEGHTKDGMTLRDYFAAQAMIGVLTMLRGGNEGLITVQTSSSKYAYEWADAMLMARENIDDRNV
jgi:hypothetical protein